MKQKLKFPKHFLWGAATAAYQVEGGIENNDWAQAGKQRRVPKAGAACDQYKRWQEDFKLAKYLHQNAHRLSLEWSRIEPEQGKFDDNAIEHYREVLSWLKANGFKTFVTLHHFTNPLWLAKEGGWEASCAPKHFAEYAAKVCRNLGKYVDFWITINEPQVYAGMAYQRELWPPFIKSYWRSYQVYKNMLAAHNAAYKVIHGYYKDAQVGFAQNIAFRESGFKALANSYYEVNFAYGRTKNDFLAVNQYFYSGRARAETTDWNIFPIYPRAIYEVLMKLKKYKKPIYITENGLPDAKDSKREKYIKSYLAEVHRAIKDGADARGYLHWSLLDNYEWAEGYKYKFGLVEVDFKTQKRTPRESAFAYSHICQDNALSL